MSEILDAQFNIGKIIDETARRDAVHFALAPVIAAVRLSPGQHIGFVGKDTVGPCIKPLGIVDPFLPNPVEQGERFWMFLYPNSITSLRHAWTHDAFSEEEEVPQENWLSQVDMRDPVSAMWLEAFAKEADISYDELMEAAKDNVEFDSYLCDGGKWEGFRTPKEFWYHYEVVTGETVDDHDANFFSCSC